MLHPWVERNVLYDIAIIPSSKKWEKDIQYILQAIHVMAHEKVIKPYFVCAEINHNQTSVSTNIHRNNFFFFVCEEADLHGMLQQK